MAEIRKYDPAVGNAIAQALRAVMGEGARPADTSQAPVAGAKPDQPEEATATSWVTLKFTEE